MRVNLLPLVHNKTQSIDSPHSANVEQVQRNEHGKDNEQKNEKVNKCSQRNVRGSTCVLNAHVTEDGAHHAPLTSGSRTTNIGPTRKGGIHSEALFQ